MDQATFLLPSCALALLLTLAGCEPSPASLALKNPPAVPPAAAAGESPATPPAEPAPVPPRETPQETPGEPPAMAAPAPVPPMQPEAPEAPESPETSVPVVGPIALADELPPPKPENAGDNLELLGASVPPGTSTRLNWVASQLFEGESTVTPVLVVNGARRGPVLCLTAAIHGDELNGIEMVRRVIHEIDADELRGSVIGIPIVNLQGFRRGSRYLPDRRDLNRYFPGNPEGSSAARIAYSLFESVIRKCDLLVDLHTGSFYRTNLPQLRADLRYQSIRDVTQGFGGMVVLHSEGALGTLRRAAADAGIPSVTLEAGEPQRLQSSKVNEGVRGVFALLSAQGMIRSIKLLGAPEPVFYESKWIRADHGGILFSVVRLGQLVQDGDVLGTVTDPITNEQNLIYATTRGRVLGMALNQVVMPGFAAFRIGIETDGTPPDSMLATAEWGQTNMQDSESEEQQGRAPAETGKRAASEDPEETS